MNGNEDEACCTGAFIDFSSWWPNPVSAKRWNYHFCWTSSQKHSIWSIDIFKWSSRKGDHQANQTSRSSTRSKAVESNISKRAPLLKKDKGKVALTEEAVGFVARVGAVDDAVAPQIGLDARAVGTSERLGYWTRKQAWNAAKQCQTHHTSKFESHMKIKTKHRANKARIIRVHWW